MISEVHRSSDAPATDIESILDVLRERLCIAVIHGGNRLDPGAVIQTARNPRSDKSYQLVAEDIAQTLAELGFKRLVVLPEDMRLSARLQEHGVHFAWLNTGGTQGYAPTCHAPAMLEMLGIPYVGHNPLNNALLDNKHAFKHVLRGIGVRTAPFVVCNVTHETQEVRCNPSFQAAFAGYPGPFVVKPVSGRASQHVHFVERPDQVFDAVRSVYQTTGNFVMVESFIGGPEYAIAVTGYVMSRGRRLYSLNEPEAFSAIERCLDPGEHIFTSMDVRPIVQERFRVLSADADQPVWDNLVTIAKQIYRAFGLEAAIRIDLRADTHGNIYVLEANPKPDLKRPDGKKICLIAAGLSQQGMDYHDLILSMLASRLGFLLRHRRDAIPRIIELLE